MSKISQRPAAGPLNGVEPVAIVQDGETRKTSVAAIAALNQAVGLEGAAVLAAVWTALAAATGADAIGYHGRTLDDKLSAVEVSIEDHGGGTGKTAAQNKAALEAAIAKVGTGGTVRFDKAGGLYQMNPVDIAASNIRLKGNILATVKWAAIGANQQGLDVTGNNFSLEDIALEGPGSEAAYVGNEIVLQVRGASTNARLNGLTLRNAYIRGSGSYGLRAQFVDGIVVDNLDVANCAHAGAMFFSCNRGRWRGGRVDMLNAVGDGGAQAYGLSLTHDSTDYNLDPNKGTLQAAHPFCSDWIIGGATIIGPKIWQGLDTHGCYNVSVVDTRVFAAKHGMSVTGSSGAATPWAGWRNACLNNVVDINLPDGTPSGAVPGEGITINGGATVPNSEMICTGNRVNGYGAAGTSRAFLASAHLRRFMFGHNIVTNWAGVAVLLQTGTTDGIVTCNVFGEPTAAGAECFVVSGAAPQRLLIEGNVAEAGAARQPNIGARLSQVAGSRVIVGANMFDLCAIPYTNPASGTAHGVGLPGQFSITGVAGAVVIDCGIGRAAPGVPITIYFSGLSGNVTSVTLNNVADGQIVYLVNHDAANTVTYTRAVSALSGAVDQVLGRFDTLALIKRPGGGNDFLQLSPVMANG